METTLPPAGFNRVVVFVCFLYLSITVTPGVFVRSDLCSAAASSRSRLGLREPQHAARDRDGSVRPSGHVRGFLQVGEQLRTL